MHTITSAMLIYNRQCNDYSHQLFAVSAKWQRSINNGESCCRVGRCCCRLLRRLQNEKVEVGQVKFKIVGRYQVPFILTSCTSHSQAKQHLFLNLKLKAMIFDAVYIVLK